ncbi:hypothetical protein [Streptomyces sp. NPDC050535]|uniref:hypothetical protein n=1 Tax=Streptomyces sp. NPDC050535 TaxID=3365626 RepID=UPI003787C646
MPRLALPESLREQLILEIYKQAEEMDWELMSNTHKTAQYRKWIEDECVGGVLLNFAPEKDVRVWIKDVPMKEYARSLEGIGGYVRFVSHRFRGAEEIVRVGLSNGWTVVADSVDEKPNHCYATNGHSKRYVCWGRPDRVSDLVWASLHIAVHDKERPMIVVTTRDGLDTSAAERTLQERIARHCGIDLRHLHRTLVPNPDYIG